MFTIDQIKEAHSKVKSGADFPRYIQDLIKMGVKAYTTFVADGHAEFSGDNNYKLLLPPKYEEKIIATTSNTEKFKHNLKIHQQGQTNFPTFCDHAAETGVNCWTTDTFEMTCTYFNLAGEKIVTEVIPS